MIRKYAVFALLVASGAAIAFVSMKYLGYLNNSAPSLKDRISGKFK
jgi:hypothetical protein